MTNQRPLGAAATAVAPIDPHCANVVAFPGSSKPVDPFGQLTARLIIAQYRAGTLDPAVVEALLLGVGLP
jgi:hypothetical protein